MDRPSIRSESDAPPSPERQAEPQPKVVIPAQPAGYKRVAWFLFIWLCSVGALAIVAGLIRWVIKP